MVYDQARAATVVAESDVTVFRLDRASFKYFFSDPPGNLTDIKAEMKKIDEVLDKVSGVKSQFQGNIIREYKPNRSWLWRQWSGTITKGVWKPTLLNMLVAMMFFTYMHQTAFKQSTLWSINAIPDPKHPAIERLLGLDKLWKIQTTVTTFILTFFLSQAWSFWREVYSQGRRIQGRLNDIGLLVSSMAKRQSNGKFTPEAETLNNDIAKMSRLFHVFSWAKYKKEFSVLTTDRGMSRMLSRGIISRKEYDALANRDQYGGAQNSCIQWILVKCRRGMKDGILPDENALRQLLYDKICTLRGTAASVMDSLDGRFPLFYVHFVQLLVDTFLMISPFALYVEMGIWAVPAVGILTLFYSGMLDAAKMMLDPIENDEFYGLDRGMDIGVLIRESNAGSTRWKKALETLPF